MAEQQITEEQAGEALQQLVGNDDESGIPQPDAPVEPEPSTEVEPEVAAAEVIEEAAPDDLESLQRRLEESESAREADTAKLLAMQERNAQNEQILRDRYLRKSTASDRALQVLKRAQSDEGASQEDVSRIVQELEGTMNAASPSYATPAPQTQQAAPDMEDRVMTMNNFLNEKSMGTEDAGEFATWMQTEAGTVLSQAEQAVAERSLDGFLRIAHPRWKQGKRDKDKTAQRNDAVEAVKTVQRTQKAAASAASGSTTAAKKQRVGSAGGEVDVSKLTEQDISDLVRQSVTQYN